MKKRTLFILLTLLAVASLVLAACGGMGISYPIKMTANKAFIVQAEPGDDSSTCSISAGQKYVIEGETEVVKLVPVQVEPWDEDPITLWNRSETTKYLRVTATDTECSGYVREDR